MVWFNVHKISALKEAVIVQGAPFEGRPVRVYDIGLIHGAGIFTLPPHEELTVNVPLAGGLVNVIVPDTS
jgi:hypothetical protein